MIPYSQEERCRAAKDLAKRNFPESSREQLEYFSDYFLRVGDTLCQSAALELQMELNRVLELVKDFRNSAKIPEERWASLDACIGRADDLLAPK
jgi:hypothetical protein